MFAAVIVMVAALGITTVGAAVTGATLTLGLAAVFFVASMVFVYRSFYGMRIEQ